ncbi:MAG TPA: hypothetical protein VNF71_11555 [Acidimicrobiales bacterium]|nr:hypothetical protein [Acidimicrobiales bacterium]
MLASVAAGHVKAGRWVLAVAPVIAAVLLMVVFGLAGGGAAATRPATNPAVSVPGLLRASDAGAGWTATHSGALVAEPAGCFHPRASMIASGPRSLVGIVLTGPGGLPQVDEIVARYATSSEAAAGYASVERTLDGCTGLVPADLAVTADRSAAALVTTPFASGTNGGSETAGVDFVVAQKGTGVVLLAYGSAGVPDAAGVSRLADRAVERLGP